LNKVKLAFAGSVTLILLLGASNIWLFTTITSLQSDKSVLTSQIQTLQDQADNLLNQLNQKNSQLLTLQDQVENLSSQISVLTQNYMNLNDSYNELLRQYEDLLFHYNLLNKPASNFTTINDLNITLAVDRTTYYYKDPVSGNVTITYLNGTAFRGVFILYIRHQTKGTSTTAGIAIDGFTEFYLSPPVFRSGPGNYTIGISSLSTTDGYIIESRWRVFPSVQVEAK